MKITYELYGSSFFHTDCIPGRNNGIVKPIRHEANRSLMECQHCGKRGYYPVGTVGEIEVVEQRNILAQAVDRKKVGG